MNAPTAVAAAIVVAAVLAGATHAGVPDATGVIHGCFKTQSGQLRVSDPDDGVPVACDSDSETALQWNLSGPQGQTGPEGDKGPAGDAGPAGLPGTLGPIVQRVFTSFFVSETKSLDVECPPGTKVINGGGTIEGAGEITQSAPIPVGEGWFVKARNDDPLMVVPWNLIGYAVCVQLP